MERELDKEEFNDRLAELSWMANAGTVRGAILADGSLHYEKLDDNGKFITICLLNPKKPTATAAPLPSSR